MPKLRLTAYLAAYFFFSPVAMALAATVHLYVDNRIARAGTARATGSSTTTLKVEDFANVNDLAVAATDADLQYMGLHIFSGSNSGNNNSHVGYKITSVNTTDAAHPVLTVDRAFASSETPEDDWSFVILYGSNVNTGASQTKGSSTTGPVNEIYPAMASSALSAQDTGHIHIRGNTGYQYTEVYSALASNKLFYNVSVGSTKSYIFEGYVTTAIPSDLAADAVKTSTYYTASTSNPAASVNKSAGQLLYEDTTTTDKFPELRYSGSGEAISIGDPAATSPSLTLRYIKMTRPASGTGQVISNANTSAKPALTIESCVIGSLASTDDNEYAIIQSGTGIVPTHAITLSKSAILSRRAGIAVTNLKTLSIDQSYFESYGKNAAGSTVSGIYSIRVDNSSAATYSAALLPTNQCQQFICTDNNLVHTATHSAGVTSSVGVQVANAVAMEICRIKGNNLSIYSRSTSISVSGASSFDIQNNRVAVSNSTAHGVGISIGADATVDTSPVGDGLLLVASGNTDATGSNVAADGSTPLALPAHTTFKLTGGSATDDVYIGMIVRKSATASGPQYSQIWDYDGTSKVAKCTPQFGNTPVGNEQWAIFRPRQQAHGVIAHNFVNSAVSTASTSHAFGLFQGCDHVDFFDNTAIGYWDNGIVLKGEYNRVINNRIHSGCGTLLIKGGSFNTVNHNTFYTANTQGGSGCLDVQDKSNVYNMASGEVPLNANHWSKATGNRVTDNIFIVTSAVSTTVIRDDPIGAGSWAGSPSAYPMGQANVFDYNVYYQAHASADLATLNGSTVAHGASIATLQAAWAAYTTAVQYGATNDAHSWVDMNPRLVDPANGDFRPQIRFIGSDGQMVGAFIPMTRASRIPVVGAGS